MKAIEVQKEITSKILNQLKEGVPVFELPFKRGGVVGLPKNAVSKKVYQGLNFWNLFRASEDMGFLVNKYMTFNQAKEKGYKVKKGAKGLKVLFYRSLFLDESGKVVKSEPDSKSNDDLEKIPFLSVSTVFNLGQIEGCEEELGIDKDLKPENENLVDFEKLGATVESHAVNSAHFNVTKNVIMLPYYSMFTDKSRYWSTVMHELIHWTGHGLRLGRDITGGFGSKKYAIEELVAEFGAAYLCAWFGLEYHSQHAAYIAAWSKDLSEKDIQSAISKSQKAANYIIEKLDS